MAARYMTTASPGDSGIGSSGDGQRSAGESAYASGESNSSRSPLHMNLGFLKNLTEKKTTRDGQPAKRRGPKPDSKPALTRRQELNRQAQRTHRERKELYIKALEQEVLRLKETVSSSIRSRDEVLTENQQLKELLRQNGLSYPDARPQPHPPTLQHSSSEGYPSSRNMSMSMASGSQSLSPPIPGSLAPPSSGGGSAPPTQLGGQQPSLDYDQIGIEFVLEYEKNHSERTPYLTPPPQPSHAPPPPPPPPSAPAAPSSSAAGGSHR
ncbi:MAG: hypothetical protein M1817_000699 [Caeruleum heppii]|nr:MAG: hypothetical protein M1817_000699 [Caeruleum heppii]